tara:strand:- start:237 stop:458 length:222 start_codon:yes stop_codon:yes gene_type:complete
MNTKIDTTHLSDQALGAIMIALQNSLLHQTDIVPTLKDLKLTVHPTKGLIVMNPPLMRTKAPQMPQTVETSVQ